MEAFAIKYPNGRLFLSSVQHTEAASWSDYGCFDEAQIAREKQKGYRCVPVQVTEIEPKEPK